MNPQQVQEHLYKLSQLQAASSQTSAGIVAANWDKIPGNSAVFTYYGGVAAGNPSGNKNVQTIEYYSGATLAFSQTFSYDADDDVVSIIAS